MGSREERGSGVGDVTRGQDPTTVPPDQGAREGIVAERRRNVSVIAGAGTGKTKTIIDRAIDLLTERDDRPPLSIRRIAAITFTRRAAGELRFRLRERLLAELERVAPGGGARAARLGEALSNLDAAFIGTIHGFADRLLRLRPVEAQLSPAYVLVEDTGELVRETFLRLRRGAEAGVLDAALGREAAGVAPQLVAEAADTLRAAAQAGVQMDRRESGTGQVASVEAMLASMVETRDVDVPLPPIPDPGLQPARAAAARFHDMQGRMHGQGVGHDRVRRTIGVLQRLTAVDDPAEAFRVVAEAQRGRQLYKGRDFGGDPLGWSVYRALHDVKPNSLGEHLHGPHRWLAARLVRLFPVVAAMYDRVKEEHEVVDFLDLLIKLRNLLRDDREARGFYQGLFDHIFVDEFQDTDPLQCEIVFYLCEHGATGADWARVELTAGKLTIVGDPKQSIYRFRRADIAMYVRAAERLETGGALVQRLETNFRSRPELIAFFNSQLAAVLGGSGDVAFDPGTGCVQYEPLRHGATVGPGGICVDLVPYADDAREGLVAGDGRVIEGAAVAHYISALLDSGRLVRDPETGAERRVRPGDIAVLAPVTTHLRQLLQRLEERGIEYTTRGGVLFLGHPTVRRFLLALRALADPEDGVAQSALLQPPFFALDWGDALAARAAAAPEVAPRVQRWEAARALIEALRAARHGRSPGATARDLIEHTALGRAVTTGHHGRQLLAALYEVAAEIDRRAGMEGLDFDAATERLREWAYSPVYLDAAEPLGNDAVRVLTIHQAKGLEFPVVVLWDGFQTLSEQGSAVWRADRDGRAWALRLGAIAVEYPAGCGLLRRERELGEQERRRLYYVAATRARDLLAVPLPLAKSERMPYATRALAANVDEALVRRLPCFTPSTARERPRRAAAGTARSVIGEAALDRRMKTSAARLVTAAGVAMRPRAVPTAVTAEAAAPPGSAEAPGGAVSDGRYGAAFGLVVHRALDRILSTGCEKLSEAVLVAAREFGLRGHVAEAEADVERALRTVREHGIDAAAGWQLLTEYSLCAALPDGKLITGAVDLLAVRGDQVALIDFKTDAPRPGTPGTAYPVYMEQLRLYAEAVTRSGWLRNRVLRCGLLLTAVPELRWLDDTEVER